MGQIKPCDFSETSSSSVFISFFITWSIISVLTSSLTVCDLVSQFDMEIFSVNRFNKLDK